MGRLAQMHGSEERVFSALRPTLSEQGQRKADRALRAARLSRLAGLLLNELLMYLFRVFWGEETVLFTVASFAVSLYVLNKGFATGLVMIWNYFTKRYILTKS